VSGRYEVILVGEDGNVLAEPIEMTDVGEASRMACRLNGGASIEGMRFMDSLAPSFRSLNRLLAIVEDEFAKREKVNG
jgi:hypothetical protein